MVPRGESSQKGNIRILLVLGVKVHDGASEITLEIFMKFKSKILLFLDCTAQIPVFANNSMHIEVLGTTIKFGPGL